jgi:hypothetical protein
VRAKRGSEMRTNASPSTTAMGSHRERQGHRPDEADTRCFPTAPGQGVWTGRGPLPISMETHWDTPSQLGTMQTPTF